MKALRTAAPALSDALGDRHRGAAARRRRSTAALASLLEELQRFSEDPLVPQRHQRHDRRRSRRSTRRCTTSRPRRRSATTLTLWFRNISSLLSEGDRNGTWQRFIIVTTPQGPNAEGGPSSAPANGPTTGQPRPHQPVPEHGRAGPAEGVRGGQRALPGRQDDDVQRAGHPVGPHGGLPLMAAKPRRRTPRRSPAFVGRDRADRRGDRLLLGFTKHIPFTHGYVLKAQFESANSIRPNSPVRIAGVEVGKVKKIDGAAGHERGAADDGAQEGRRCRSTRTRRRRSARASSSRATSSSTSSRARRARRTSRRAAR